MEPIIILVGLTEKSFLFPLKKNAEFCKKVKLAVALWKRVKYNSTEEICGIRIDLK